MGDTFGAGMDPVVDSVRGYPDSYLRRPPFEGAATPAPSGDGSSGLSIKQINAQIMNQHPEMLTALSGQWARLHDWLEGQRSQLHKQSKALHRTWSSPAAVEFLRRGPGRTLAYLDDWIRAADANIRALQSLAGIITKARTEMKDLWTEYSNAMTDIRTMHWLERPHENPWTSPVALQLELVQACEHEYNLKAQQLASRVANDIHMANLRLAEGHGMPLHPHDAVLNLPGHPPFPGAGGVPPGGTPPRLGRRPDPPSGLPPTPSRADTSGALAARPGAAPAQPPAPDLPTGTAPALPAVPATPPLAALRPGVVPAVPALPAVPVTPVTPVTPVGPVTAAPAASPAGLTLRAASGASPALPGTALPPPAARQLGGPGTALPASPGQRVRDGLDGAALRTPTPAVTQPFAPPASGAVPPVLGGQRKRRRAEPPAANDAEGVVSGPTVPTVFAGPAANPTAARTGPAKRRREAAGHDAAMDWLGVNTATADTATPVLGAGLGAQLAARDAAAAIAGTPSAQRRRSVGPRPASPDPAADELTVRRMIASEMDDAEAVAAREWAVSSPGGAVVGRDTPLGYREEPKPTLGQG